MNKRMISFVSILLLIVLAGALLASCGSSSKPASAPAPSGGGSTADGQTLMQTRCSVCHSLDRVTSAHKTAAQWKTTVDRMINNGAQLSPSEEQVLVNYLAQTYP
jgi:cytochrome c5